MGGKHLGLSHEQGFEVLGTRWGASVPGWLRTLFSLPSFKVTGVYALPLQILASVFAASNVAFLARMLASPWLALCLTTVVAASVYLLFRRADVSEEERRTSRRLWVLALPIALGLCLLGGEGRLFYANPDWLVRDAVLADLSTRPWPVHYATAQGAGWVLRAPLGLYVLPSMVGQVLGLRAAHLALLIQDTTLLAGVLVIFMATARTLTAQLGVAAVFVMFSGWDWVGTMLAGRTMFPAGASRLAPHLEWWGPLQYSSLITDLFWAPNHGLPAWALVAGYAAWRARAASSLHLGALLGLTLLWSPLIVMGALPFVVLALLTDMGRRRMGLAAPAVLLPLAASLLPVALYLTLDDAKVVQGLTGGSEDFLPTYLRFVLIEVCPLLLLGSLWVGSQDRNARLDLLICAALLGALPLYRIGDANDFMMRASIFPITLIFVIAAQGLASTSYSESRLRVLSSLVILTYGAATPVLEIARAVLTPVNPPMGRSLTSAMGTNYSNNYLHAYLSERSTYESIRLLRVPENHR